MKSSVLEEHIYSVLVVSSSDNFNNSLSELLPVFQFYPVHYVSGISAAKRILNERNFDIVVINSPLPDDVGTGFAVDISSGDETVCLFIARADVLENFRKRFIVSGVFSLPKPLSMQTFSLALEWMMSVRERIRKLETKALSIEEKMAEIRLVNRAKWLLITELNMEEPLAHRFIEKQAMDHCVSRRKVAEEIIKTYT